MSRRSSNRSRAARRARPVVGLGVFVALVAAASLFFSGAFDGLAGGRSMAVVQRVVDGDTILVDYAGTEERVRLLNIDTPESVQPDSPVECLGREASDFLTALLPAGTEVTLEFDRERRDSYGRMLAAVSTANGSLVNAEIARAGLAETLVVGENDRFESEVAAAVTEAKTQRRGLWAPGACS